MKLARLRLDRAPGLDKGLGEHRFEAGLNVVFGPNESGKSTLARVIQSTLWPEGRRDGLVYDARSDWEEDGVDWSARFDGDTVWSRGDESGDGPALPPRENATAYRLHLRDLIAGADEDGDTFAMRVRAALDGGFDLAKRVTGERGRRYGTKEKGDLVDAEAELRRIEASRADLGRRYDELEQLSSRQIAADAARGDVVHLERALQWQAARDELERARAELEADPTPDLGGHEGDELARLDRELERVDAEYARHERALQAAREQRAGAALPAVVPDDETIAAWLDEARSLAQHEVDLEAARDDMARAVEAEAHARRALLAAEPQGDAATPPQPAPSLEETERLAPSLEEIEQLAQWLELRASAAAERRVLEARAARLAARGEAAARAGADPLEALDREALEEARRIALRTGASGPGVVMPLVGAVAGGGAVVATVWQGVLPLPAPQTGALAGLAALAPLQTEVLAALAAIAGGALGLLAGRLTAARARRRALEETGVAAELVAGPGAELLDALQRALAGRARAEERAREHADIEAERVELDRAAPQLEERRRVLVEGFGIDPGVEDLTLVTWARRIHDHEQAVDTLVRARAYEAGRRAGFEAARAAQIDRIGPFSSLPPATPGEIAAAVQALRKRLEVAARARDEIGRCEDALGSLSQQRGERVAERDALLARLRLDDLDAATARERLQRWLDALDGRRGRQQRVRDATAAVAEHARALERHPELMQLDAAALERRLAHAREQQGEADALREALSALRKEVELAEAEDRVEVALARVDAARAALEGRRMEVFEGASARLLLDDVSEQIGTRHRPEVLSRATELFGLFTRHRYELEVATLDDQVRFVARATETNERKKLAQLSDGTRMQLLLAARLAFVHDGERGVQPPLVLDEALSSSDAARMDAMTDALVAEAQTGRQIFYMTNDPGDVASWRQACERAGAPAPHVVALGEAQRAAMAERWDGFEPPEAPAPVPAPGDLDAAAYGQRLGVPLPDPWAELGELHLFHLLSDDLALLHRVLDQGHVDRLGHFESRRRSGAAETLLGVDVVEKVVFRAQVAEHFLAAWRRGRGRPIRPGDLDACEALGGTFRGRVAEVAEAEGGDAVALMARIQERDPRLARLGKRREGLEAFLHEHGFLTSDEPLDDDALVSEVSARVSPALFELGRDEARRRLHDAEHLVRLWSSLLAHGDGAA